MTNMAHIKVTSINTCQTKKILLQYLYSFFKGVGFFALDSYSDISSWQPLLDVSTLNPAGN